MEKKYNLYGDYPIEIREKIKEAMKYSFAKRAYSDKTYKGSDSNSYGFDWSKSLEGHAFWSNIFFSKEPDFTEFYKLYPIENNKIKIKSKDDYLISCNCGIDSPMHEIHDYNLIDKETNERFKIRIQNGKYEWRQV